MTTEHHIARARQEGKALAVQLGFSQTNAACVATSISEMASNLFFHAHRGGTITLSVLNRPSAVGLEVIAEDDGPGIPDIKLAMQDGFTTNRGLGGGLPGTERLMDEFEITSRVGDGTRIVARKWQPCP